MYKLVKNLITNDDTIVCKVADNAYIPFDTANVDYQEYLRWLEAGNTPDPADELPQ